MKNSELTRSYSRLVLSFDMDCEIGEIIPGYYDDGEDAICVGHDRDDDERGSYIAPVSDAMFWGGIHTDPNKLSAALITAGHRAAA